MNTPDSKHVLSLLETIHTKPVETYIYFPEIIRSGPISLEKEDFDFLFTQGYLEESLKDKFGKNFRLSEKAKQVLKNRE